MADYILDSYTFNRSEWPARGSIADDIAPQRWSKQDILGTANPGSVLTFLGTQSPEWPLVSNASEVLKDKLIAVHAAKVAVVFKTPYNVSGFNVIMSRLFVEHRETVRGDIFVCRYTLVKR